MAKKSTSDSPKTNEDGTPPTHTDPGTPGSADVLVGPSYLQIIITHPSQHDKVNQAIYDGYTPFGVTANGPVTTIHLYRTNAFALCITPANNPNDVNKVHDVAYNNPITP